MIGLLIFAILTLFFVVAVLAVNWLLKRNPAAEFSTTPPWFLPVGLILFCFTFVVQITFGFLLGILRFQSHMVLLLGFTATGCLQAVLFLYMLMSFDKSRRHLIGAKLHQFGRNVTIGLQTGVVLSALNVLSLKIFGWGYCLPHLCQLVTSIDELEQWLFSQVCLVDRVSICLYRPNSPFHSRYGRQTKVVTFEI